jgi:hypothetical protein
MPYFISGIKYNPYILDPSVYIQTPHDFRLNLRQCDLAPLSNTLAGAAPWAPVSVGPTSIPVRGTGRAPNFFF